MSYRNPDPPRPLSEEEAKQPIQTTRSLWPLHAIWMILIVMAVATFYGTAAVIDYVQVEGHESHRAVWALTIGLLATIGGALFAVAVRVMFLVPEERKNIEAEQRIAERERKKRHR